MKRLIVGISGASGAIYGIRLLEVLRDVDDVATHLVMTNAARRTVHLETDHAIEYVEALPDEVHKPGDIAASPASGSFRTTGMVIVPCSIKTLSGVAHSYSDNLLLRAADVVLKERRKLVLALRETPLHLGHVELMRRAIEMGAIVAPLMPAFYHHPKTVDDIVNQSINRVLDLLDIELPEDLFQRWRGP